VNVIVVSFFPGNGSQEAVGGFDWYPDTIAGGVGARKRTFSLMTDLDSMPSVTVCRLEVPVDPESKGWQAEVTRWLDENAHLRELPDQSVKPSHAARDAHPDGSTVTLWTTGVIPPNGDWGDKHFWTDGEAARDSAATNGTQLVAVTLKVVAAEVLQSAEDKARKLYERALGRTIMVDRLCVPDGSGDAYDVLGKFRVRVVKTHMGDVGRYMGSHIDPIWTVELEEVIEGDQKKAWTAGRLEIFAPSYFVRTGELDPTDQALYDSIVSQLQETT
jgi:hypothetical protein